METAAGILERSRHAVQYYAELSSPTRPEQAKLADACCRLARVDLAFRARLFDELLKDPSEDEVGEVVDLLSVIPPNHGRMQHVHLNPTFGVFSMLAGGADADLMLDDELVDLKTVKDAVVEKAMVRQLVGYLLLARAAKAAGQSLPTIEVISIYFSRYAHTWSLPVSKLLAHPLWRGTEEWFTNDLLRSKQDELVRRLQALRSLPRRQAVTKGVRKANAGASEGIDRAKQRSARKASKRAQDRPRKNSKSGPRD